MIMTSKVENQVQAGADYTPVASPSPLSNGHWPLHLFSGVRPSSGAETRGRHASANSDAPKPAEVAAAEDGRTPLNRDRPLATRPWSLFLSLVLLVFGTGCRVVKGAADLPGKTVRAVVPGQKDKRAVDPVELQQMLLRFADEFSTRMVVGVEKIRQNTNALSAAQVLQWKIALSTEATSIGSGPNAVANLLDMTVFVTVTRMALEEHWQPKVLGEAGRPILESARNAELEIWRLADTVLTPDQQAELRRAIETWHRQNPLPESVVAARALGFATEVAQTNPADAAKTQSVFGLLRVDPLAGMDPAVREIAQTRLFAERALFVTRRMPMALRWQTELLSVNALDLPTVQQLVTNSTQISASVERFAGVAERLPGQVSREREEILKALESQERNLKPLVNEVEQVLTAGTQMSTSLNTTLTTFDAVMKRFGVGEPNSAGPPKTNAEPFRIQDYTQTAAQLEATARQLTELLRTLDNTIGSTNVTKLTAQITPVVQQAQTGGKEIVDLVFHRAILFVAIASGIVLIAGWLYRLSSGRLTPKPTKTNSV